MFAPGIVIYEKSSRWEAMLKRHFLETCTIVRPCRLPRQVLAQLSTMRKSVVLVDLSAGAESALRLITQTRLQFSDSPIVVLVSPGLQELEWPAREFGAWSLVPDSVNQVRLGHLCADLLNRSTQPPPS